MNDSDAPERYNPATKRYESLKAPGDVVAEAAEAEPDAAAANDSDDSEAGDDNPPTE